MVDRVLIIDDSAIIRRLLSDTLSSDPGIEVVGYARNGKEGLDQIEKLRPDLVTLDIEMPVMDGLTTLIEIRKRWRRLPVVMFSTLTERGAQVTFQALEKGADDYVAKPSNTGSMAASLEAIRAQLIPTIHALCARRRPAPPGGSTTLPRPTSPGALTPPAVSHPGQAPAGARPVGRAPAPPPNAAPRVRGVPGLLAIGSSTGGPEALTSFLSGLPSGFPLPIVVTQHMPPVFTKQFAERLDARLPFHVKEAEEGDQPAPGRVLIAPGDWHMLLRRKEGGIRVHLDQGPKENFCRPAVDPMLRSAVETYGPGVLTVILTGMGSDGSQGAGVVRSAGGRVLVQDEATSVVWGMPGSTVAAGNADEVLPLQRLPLSVSKLAGPAKAPAPA